MATPGDAAPDGDYEEYVELQCPICKEPVSDNDDSCPGCGAIFVESEEDITDLSLDGAELEIDYQLDDSMDFGDIDEAELEAELAAIEAEVNGDLMMDASGGEPFDLDLAYEDELEAEEEEEQVFGSAVKVSAEDHRVLEEMSKPNILERTFQRMGLGLFIAGGLATVLIVLWDPLNGNPLSLGMTQWRFLVLALAMFMVGFAIEMVQAYSLSHDDERLIRELMEA